MFWLNLLLLLALVAGHCEVVAAAVNRTHAWPLSRRTLRRIRYLHDLWMPLFPVLLLTLIGLSGPRLLLGGSWREVPWPWRIYFGVCAFGFIALCVSAVNWWRHRNRQARLTRASEIVDIADQLGFLPVGDGRHQRLARFPLNQQVQVEFNEKILHLPRLPQAWDGLSILHLSDLHYTGALGREFYGEVFQHAAEIPVDFCVFTGDLIDDPRFLDWIAPTLGQLSAPLGCYFILGNHDWEQEPQRVRAVVAALGWTDLAGRITRIEHRGQILAMGGSERPWMGTHPDFAAVPDADFRLLLSHTPDNLPCARQAHVDLMLSGHNHGGQVVLPMIGPVYAPSRYGIRYAGGVYRRDPVLLHVSRGISGEHALRVNCRPEMTRLVLKSGSPPAREGGVR